MDKRLDTLKEKGLTLLSQGVGKGYGYLRAVEEILNSGVTVDEVISGVRVKYVGDKIINHLKEPIMENTIEVNPHKHPTAVKDLEKYIKTLDAWGIKGTITGSFRRGRKVVGDLDILVKEIPAKILRTMEGYNLIKILSMGDKKAQLAMEPDGFEVDLRVYESKNEGTFLLHSTGPWEFNVLMRRHSKDMGYTLSEYGLYDEMKNVMYTFKNEKDVFEFLGLEYVEPKDRDSCRVLKRK